MKNLKIRNSPSPVNTSLPHQGLHQSHEASAVHVRQRHAPLTRHLGSVSENWEISSLPKRKRIFQPSFFRGYVKLRGCIDRFIAGDDLRSNMICKYFSDLAYVSSCRLNHPVEKYARQIGSFPQGWKFKKRLKPPPSRSIYCRCILKKTLK